MEPAQVNLSCMNQFGQDSIHFNITILPSYEAVLDPVPYGPFRTATPVRLSGRVSHVPGSFLEGVAVPVDIV